MITLTAGAGATEIDGVGLGAVGLGDTGRLRASTADSKAPAAIPDVPSSPLPIQIDQKLHSLMV